MGYAHGGILFIHQKEEVLSFAGAWAAWEVVKLSEVQREAGTV